MNGTVTAISAGANAQSAAAMAEAHEAKVKACEAIIQNFDSKGATIEAMKLYADCVQFMHPDDLTPDEVYLLRLAVVICFAGAVAAAVYSFKKDNSIPLCVIGFVCGFFVTGVSIFIFSLLVYMACFAMGWNL